MRNFVTAAAAGAMLLLAAAICAQPVEYTILNTLGPGNSYDPEAKLPVRGESSALGPGAGAAVRIDMPNAQGRLRLIELALVHVPGSSGLFEISLHEGSQTSIGPAVWSHTILIEGLVAPVMILRPGGSQEPLLSSWSGEHYWLVVMPGDAGSAANWHLTNQGMTGAVAVRQWDSSAGQWGSWLITTGAPLPAARVTIGECYANCDPWGPPPILNVQDFTCFINMFAAASALPHAQQVVHYANCDASTTPPVLNVEDFACFINAFAGGC
jgi:hypothetical protein